MNQMCVARRIKRAAAYLVVMVLFCTLGIQPAYAASSYIGSIRITLDVDPEPGDSLPSLDVGYSSDNGYEVMVPSNDKYEIKSAEWSSKIDEVKLGGVYTMKIILETMNDYKFNSSYPSSRVDVKGGTYVDARRLNNNRLQVTVKTRPAKGSLEEPDDAHWETTRMTSSKLGLAKWDRVDRAAYDVQLYRGSKLVHKATEVSGNSYNFYPYMTVKGTYSFRVRAVPGDDETAKYAEKSDWALSDEIYLEAEYVSDGAGQSGANSSIPAFGEMPETNQVGWIESGGRWYFRYPDGSYIQNSWAKIGSYWYLFDGAGMMQTGWQNRNGSYYYMNKQGAMQTGWLADGGSWYYLLDDGRMATGWIQLGDKHYYLYSNGVMAAGWQEIDEKTYYFHPDGHRASNEWVSGFYVDGNGVWTKP